MADHGHLVTRAVGRLALALVLAWVLTGCGASSGGLHTATETPITAVAPTSILNYGAQYLALIAKVNETTHAYNFELAAFGRTRTAARIASIAGPVIGALEAFRAAALLSSWPPSAVADIHAEVSAFTTLEADLHDVTNAPSLAEWSNQFDRDNAATFNAATVARADLDLPPPRAFP